MIYMEQFRDRLKEARKKAGLSQRDLAKMIGCDQSLIAHFEKGRKRPSQGSIISLANVLRVSTDYLLGRPAKTHYQEATYKLGKDTKKRLELWKNYFASIQERYKGPLGDEFITFLINTWPYSRDRIILISLTTRSLNRNKHLRLVRTKEKSAYRVKL